MEAPKSNGIKPNMCEKYKESEVIIRPAKREDMMAVVEMIQELADFEKMPEGPKLSLKDLERDCFDLQPPAFRCLVAELCAGSGSGSGSGSGAGGQLVGYAVYFPTYSTWEGRALMLEDLCVRREARRRGVGGRLFDAVAKEAGEVGTRLDFHVLEWNPAREFYESRGALDLSLQQHWRCYRLHGAALAARAASASASADCASTSSDDTDTVSAL